MQTVNPVERDCVHCRFVSMKAEHMSFDDTKKPICVIIEAFANSVHTGGHDYLSKLPQCLEMARESEWEEA